MFLSLLAGRSVSRSFSQYVWSFCLFASFFVPFIFAYKLAYFPVCLLARLLACFQPSSRVISRQFRYGRIAWHCTGIERNLLSKFCLLVCCLTSQQHATCISGTDMNRQFYVLPHSDRSCRSNFLPPPSHSVLTPGPPVPALTL